MFPGLSRSSGGPAPAGIDSKPIHSCPCGAMYSGGSHACRETKRAAEHAAERAAEREAEHEREAGG